MHVLTTAVVFVCYLVAIASVFVIVWYALPGLAGISGATGPLVIACVLCMGSYWLATALTDYAQPPDVKAMKAAEDALRERREDAREKKQAAEDRDKATAQLEARKHKLQDDLEWERIQNDPVAKAKLQAETKEANARKLQQQVDDENGRIAKWCDREVETWPNRPLPVRCASDGVNRLMRFTPEQQAALAKREDADLQDKLDRADAERCDVYFRNWPNGRAWPRCSAPGVQRFLRTRSPV
jgi:hypothetical protein